PKAFDSKSFVDIVADECVIPPNSFALASTIEYFRIPRDVLTVCLGKSTYARCGIIVNVTPFEPEWEGHVTIEISNTTPLPAKIYANEGIAQVLFFQSDEPCATPRTFTPVTAAFDYVRRDVMIPMRDGVKLHTVILVPKSALGGRSAPILLTRTPYNATELTSHNQSANLSMALDGYDNAVD